MIQFNTTAINSLPVTKDYYKSKGCDLDLGHSVADNKTKDMYHVSGKVNYIKDLNNCNKKTASDVSFGGLQLSNVEKITKSFSWKLFNKDFFKKFITMASSSQSIFDAIFALGITCLLRPAAIMAQSTEKTKEKNKKASAHSISSGLIGYGFAVAIFSPIKTALDKLKKDPAKYAKKAEKFFKSQKNAQTFTMVVNKSSEVLTASIRSAITIALIPVIDKYLLNKIFGKSKQNDNKNNLENPLYKFSYVNFKNNINNSSVFQTFTGVMK